jgi:hypothetical protein
MKRFGDFILVDESDLKKADAPKRGSKHPEDIRHEHSMSSAWGFHGAMKAAHWQAGKMTDGGLDRRHHESEAIRHQKMQDAIASQPSFGPEEHEAGKKHHNSIDPTKAIAHAASGQYEDHPVAKKIMAHIKDKWEKAKVPATPEHQPHPGPSTPKWAENLKPHPVPAMPDKLKKSQSILNKSKTEELAGCGDFMKDNNIKGGYASKSSIEDREGHGKSYAQMAKNVLTAEGREHIKPKNFALGGGRYPIENREHAIAALARVSQHGTPEEIKEVHAAVHKKYPSLNKALAGDGTLMMSFNQRREMEKNDSMVSGTTITDPNKGGEQANPLKPKDKGLMPEDHVPNEEWLQDKSAPTQSPGNSHVAPIKAISGTEGQAGGTSYTAVIPSKQGSFPVNSAGTPIPPESYLKQVNIKKSDPSRCTHNEYTKKGDGTGESMAKGGGIKWTAEDIARGLAARAGGLNTMWPNVNTQPLVKREARQSRAPREMPLHRAIEALDDGREF